MEEGCFHVTTPPSHPSYSGTAARRVTRSAACDIPPSQAFPYIMWEGKEVDYAEEGGRGGEGLHIIKDVLYSVTL